MGEILGSPIWQGVGVLATIILGLIGFYYSKGQKFWLYIAGSIALLLTGLWIGSLINRDVSNYSLKNRLITHYDFENNSQEGWSILASNYYDPSADNIASSFPNPDFPGHISVATSSDYALTGNSSLKISTSARDKGRFRNYVTNKVGFLPKGANLFVLLPSTSNLSDVQVSLCTSEENCSVWTNLVVGKWTPMTADWGKTDLRFTDITLRIDYGVNSPTSFDVFVDAIELFNQEQ